jgi:hypothetical protein
MSLNGKKTKTLQQGWESKNCSLAPGRSWLCGVSGTVSRARARGIFLRESLSKVAAAAALQLLQL